MSKRIQLRRGTTAETNAFTGAVGEVTVDTNKKTVVVHDGTTVGGFPVASKANADGTISLIKKNGTSAGTINALGLFNNTLTSTNTDQALTAAQGKVLKDTLDTKQSTSSVLGVGQTWKDVTSSRSSGVTYTNTTGKPIQIHIMTGTESSTLVIDGVNIAVHGDSMPQIIVPNTSSYRFNGVTFMWAELR